MSRTKFRIADRKDIFLYMTRVENLFINEFLPGAPGDYVKLYLFALMYAQYEEEIDTAGLARTLGMETFEVEEAWDYWEARGLVRRSSDGNEIEFLRMVERFYGKDKDVVQTERKDILDSESSEGADAEDDIDFTEYDEDAQMERRSTAEYDRRLTSEQLRMIFARLQEVSGRTISRKETEKITDALTIYDIRPEVLYYAIDYCADIDNTNADYITKVALRWKEEGCEDRASVRALLEKHSERNIAYREIFRAVGFNRLTTAADREIMDRWFDEMGFKLDEVLEACRATGGIREPSLRYVNKILENKMLERGGVKPSVASGAAGEGRAPAGGGGAKVSRKVLRDYYEHIREEEEKAQAARIRQALSKEPVLEEVLEREQAITSEMLSSMTGPSGRSRREQLKEERSKLGERKKSLLAAAGYPADFLERRYRCNICKDTGYTDEGAICTCCRARADEAYMWIQEKERV